MHINIYVYIIYDKKFSILSMLTLTLTLRVSCVPSGCDLLDYWRSQSSGRTEMCSLQFWELEGANSRFQQI